MMLSPPPSCCCFSPAEPSCSSSQLQRCPVALAPPPSCRAVSAPPSSPGPRLLEGPFRVSVPVAGQAPGVGRPRCPRHHLYPSRSSEPLIRAVRSARQFFSGRLGSLPRLGLPSSRAGERAEGWAGSRGRSKSRSGAGSRSISTAPPYLRHARGPARELEPAPSRSGPGAGSLVRVSACVRVWPTARVRCC